MLVIQTSRRVHDIFIIFASTHFARRKAVIIRGETGRDIANISAANYFSAETFSDPLACLRTQQHERGTRPSGELTKILLRLLPGLFLRIRSELRRGHYGNNRSRISPAINSGSAACVNPYL